MFAPNEVTAVDVRFAKRTTGEHVRIPLLGLSEPWGTEAEGGIRAIIERGALRFDTGSHRWGWLP